MRLKLLVTRPLLQQLGLDNNNENVKDPHCWPCVRWTHQPRVDSLHKRPVMQKASQRHDVIMRCCRSGRTTVYAGTRRNTATLVWYTYLLSPSGFPTSFCITSKWCGAVVSENMKKLEQKVYVRDWTSFASPNALRAVYLTPFNAFGDDKAVAVTPFSFGRSTHFSRLIQSLRPADERRRYFATTSLVSRVQV